MSDGLLGVAAEGGVTSNCAGVLEFPPLPAECTGDGEGAVPLPGDCPMDDDLGTGPPAHIAEAVADECRPCLRRWKKDQGGGVASAARQFGPRLPHPT